MHRNRISVTERGAGQSDFKSHIYQYMQRFLMPVIETPEGDIIQDGKDILAFLERHGLGREPLFPTDTATKAGNLLASHGMTIFALGFTFCVKVT